jgi:hypothetical protein
MTRGELLAVALKILGADEELAAGRDWLDMVLKEIETSSVTPQADPTKPVLDDDIAGWKFLENSKHHYTGNDLFSIAFSDWGGGTGITNYSKGMRIASSAVPRELVFLDANKFNEMADTTEGNPRYFKLTEGEVTAGKYISLFPRVATGTLPLLTARWYEEITLPTSDTDELTTTVGIPAKYEKYLIDGVVAIGSYFMDDNRAERFEQKWLAGLNLMRLDNANK